MHGGMRSVLAILLGGTVFVVPLLLVFLTSAHRIQAPASPALALIIAIVGALSAASGGYLAARIPHKRKLLHAVFVACLIAIGALALLIDSGQGASTSTEWLALWLMAPAAIVGGWLRTRPRGL